MYNCNCRRNCNSNRYSNYRNSSCNSCVSNYSNRRRCCCNSEIYENICNNSNSTPAFPENYLYGHAYTPVQTMENVFVPEVGLKNGTIFPELVSHYEPGQSMDFINYLKEDGGVHCE